MRPGVITHTLDACVLAAAALLLPVEATRAQTATENLVSREQAAAVNPDALLQRHMSFVGGEERMRLAGSVEFRGELQSQAAHLRYRVLIRAAPYAVREEHESLTEPRERGVAVSNCDRAWELEIPASIRRAPEPFIVAPGKRGPPVPGGHGLTMLERTGVLRLLVQPWTLRGTGRAANPTVLPDVPIESGIVAGGPVQVVSFRTGPETMVSGLYAVSDGRLLGVGGGEPALGPAWYRFDDWRETDGVLWPMLWVSGSGAAVVNVNSITEVDVRQPFDDSLFAGDPAPLRRHPEAVAPLRVVHSALPGSGYLVVNEVRLRTAPTSAVFDTAADRIHVYDSLARSAGLLLLGRAQTDTNMGRTGAMRCWIDELRLGAAPLVQCRGFTFAGGSMPELLPEAQPAVVVGAIALRDDAPVFDLQAGWLVLRSSPALPLERLLAASFSATDSPALARALKAEPTVLHVPLIPEANGGPFVSVDVHLGDRSARLVVDTGMPYDARLMRGALAALGLPETRAEWLARGAVPFAPTESSDGRVLLDLLVRLDALELPCREGTIVLRQPWVLLSGADLDGATDTVPFDGLLGAGALLPFARIGWRPAEDVIELQVGPDVRAAEPGRWVVPPRGEFLGFTLDAPAQPTSSGRDGLPRLVRVSAGTAAAAAGLRAGDSLSSVGGASCRGISPSDYWPALWPAEGTQVEIEVLRADETTLSVTLP